MRISGDCKDAGYSNYFESNNNVVVYFNRLKIDVNNVITADTDEGMIRQYVCDIDGKWVIEWNDSTKSEQIKERTLFGIVGVVVDGITYGQCEE